MITRRSLLLAGAGALGAGAGLLGRFASGADGASSPPAGEKGSRPSAGAKARRPGEYTPVTTPNGSTLPWTMEKGVKVFRLTAEPVKREFAPGMVINCWGYNGQTPGPTIEAVEGDHVRIHLTNNLPEPTSIHWHGVLLPNSMDGVGGLTQPHVQPGESFTYEFTLRQNGTQMYHPHVDEMTQIALGMQGFFIIHPREPQGPRVDRDFCIFLNEWRIDPGTATPNALEMVEFTHFTFNSRVFPGTAPLVVRKGQRVRIRCGNIMMNSHPIHLHGFQFVVTGTDAGPIPESARFPETTILLSPGQTRAFEFVADAEGDWPLHCHKTHHTMNGMSHKLPNLLGVRPGGAAEKIEKVAPGTMLMGEKGNLMDHDMGSLPNTLPMVGPKGPFGDVIDMGGMFTLVKVREGITSYEDPGWYRTEPDPLWGRASR